MNALMLTLDVNAHIVTYCTISLQGDLGYLLSLEVMADEADRTGVASLSHLQSQTIFLLPNSHIGYVCQLGIHSEVFAYRNNTVAQNNLSPKHL